MFDKLLKGVKTIAIVGLSDKPERHSYQVATYLQSQGFRIIPINPNVHRVIGETSYPTLLDVPAEVDIDVVDIFRKSEEILPHVKEAIRRGDIKTIWMQEGVQNKEAEQLAKKSGLHVVSNFCLMKAHRLQNKE